MEWITTYAVHSTALVLVVWALTSLVPRISLGTKEALWKVALLGPLLTASVHQLGGTTSVWGDVPLPAALRTATGATAAATQASTPSSDQAAEAVVERRVVIHRAGEIEITATRERQPAVAPAAVAAAPAPSEPSPWPAILLGLWVVGATIAVGRLGWAAWQLRKRLATRRDVIEDPVLESFLALCATAELRKRPRLTASPHLRSPIALGRREIVLPERAVDSLSPLQQQSMLAHEMAHLVRRDPQWSVVAAIVEAVFFFQPLNHLARRKIQEVAEYQCDDWAARQAGTGVHLAKCLAEVAGWVEDGPPVSPVVTAMADRGSPIVRRITRLLHRRRQGGRVHPMGRLALTLGSLALVVALVPGTTLARTPARVGPDAEARVLQAATPAGPLVFEEGFDGRHDRALLRLRSGDEVVEIEVQAPRDLPPPPPPPPPPAPPQDRIEIMIHGHGHPFCCGGHGWGFEMGWFGMLGMDLGPFVELDGLFGDPDFGVWVAPPDVHFDLGRAHAQAERARERAERAQERAERAQERAQRAQERAQERAQRHFERHFEPEVDRRVERHVAAPDALDVLRAALGCDTPGDCTIEL